VRRFAVEFTLLGPGSRRGRLIAVLCCLAVGACASQRRPDQVEDLLSQAYRSAEAHHEFDLDPEAAVLLDAITAVDEGYPGLRELDEDLDPAAREGMNLGLLGMNRKLRPQLERTQWTRALLWLPDRLLDLLDVATVGIHLGPGAFADAHLTRALQVSAGFRTTGGVGLHDHRSLGLKSQAEAGLTLVAAGAQTYGGAVMGTTGTHGVADSSRGLHRPTALLYRRLRDYWAIGASATAAFIGVEVDLHPVQLADFFAGIVGIDFLNDDLAHTRSLKLDSVESELLTEIWKVRRSKRTLAAYLESRRSRALSDGGTSPAFSAEPTEEQKRTTAPSESRDTQGPLLRSDPAPPASAQPE
jgi:hypothetical protein